jgi:lipid II:glycine glycyltransferase (peptidoglycan interpeptide bridge formation enzyme)
MSLNYDTWNETIKRLPGANFLQTREWAIVKERVGWEREEYTWRDGKGEVIAAAQLLIRSKRLLRFGPRISIGYIPRGPLAAWEEPGMAGLVLNDIQNIARQKKLVFLKIDPEIPVMAKVEEKQRGGAGDSGEKFIKEICARGWRYSPEQVQFKNTMLLDLEGDEAVWLAKMKQKTRYNLRLAQKSGVMVRKALLAELPLLYRMFAETANRDGFIIRPEAYYVDVWSRFIKAGMAEALIAEFDGVPVAGLVFFFFGKRAWFVYGMSTSQHREKMPNYLLQWEAMCSAREKGCTEYDLWGAPDTFDKNDPMYGVYRFKEGLGAEVLCTIGAWDYPVRPLLYQIYHQVIPRLLTITRFFRRKQIQQEVL